MNEVDEYARRARRDAMIDHALKVFAFCVVLFLLSFMFWPPRARKTTVPETCLAARVSVQDTITALEDPTEHRAIFAQRGRMLLARVEPCVNAWLPSVARHVRDVDAWNLEAYRDENYGYRDMAERLRALLGDL